MLQRLLIFLPRSSHLNWTLSKLYPTRQGLLRSDITYMLLGGTDVVRDKRPADIPPSEGLRNTCRMPLNQPWARPLKQDGSSLKLKYRPTGSAIVCLIGLGVVGTLLFMGRSREELRPEFVIAVVPDFYAHISNFVITFEIVLLISFVWLLRGLNVLPFVWLFSVAIVLNLIIESFVWILNTPDILDAVFGIFGVLIAMVCTLLLKTFGISEVVEKQASN